MDPHRVVTSPKDKTAELRRLGYSDMDNLFRRIENGEQFTPDQLSAMGYDRFGARNIAHFIRTGEVISLCWESCGAN